MPTKLYVGNLSFTTTDSDLHGLFATQGEVVSATVVHDSQTGRSRGFGFVEMAQPEDARQAIENLDQAEFMGRTLRVNAGLEVRHDAGRLAVRLRGVSVMGVPLPNAWLGNLKNVDLVAEFGNDPGFWRSLAAGIEDLRIADGQVVIELRE